MQHMERTRSFSRAPGPVFGSAHPHVHVCADFAGHPLGAGAVTMARIDFYRPAQGPPGEPYAGMDPSNPVTWVRPWNPAPGMIARLNFDGAARQGDTPMGGTWRNPMIDRKTTRKRIRLWQSARSSSPAGS
jgi:hypothetical protein